MRLRPCCHYAQVELAQSEYQLPRLTRMWTHLERQSGSGQVGLAVGNTKQQAAWLVACARVRSARSASVQAGLVGDQLFVGWDVL